MAATGIKKESINFIKLIAKNNDRDWFNTHKEDYTAAHGNIISFADELIMEMKKNDTIETASGKASLFRIYRDVRFSKDKSPYHNYWSGSLKRATKKLRGGYYFHLEPGNYFVAGGFWGPEAPDMQRIRQDIDFNYKEWRKMLSAKTLVATFGSLDGEKVSSAPRGYAKDHPAIDLLRYKQFILRHNFTEKEVLDPGFAKTASDTFKKMRPFLNYMSEVLTTDGNGNDLV
jgi:uncharacterized protein (TIGR02453 family)